MSESNTALFALVSVLLVVARTALVSDSRFKHRLLKNREFKRHPCDISTKTFRNVCKNARLFVLCPLTYLICKFRLLDFARRFPSLSIYLCGGAACYKSA